MANLGILLPPLCLCTVHLMLGQIIGRIYIKDWQFASIQKEYNQFLTSISNEQAKPHLHSLPSHSGRISNSHYKAVRIKGVQIMTPFHRFISKLPPRTALPR